MSYSVTAAAVTPGNSPSTRLFMGLIGYNAPSRDAVAYFDNVVIDVL